MALKKWLYFGLLGQGEKAKQGSRQITLQDSKPAGCRHHWGRAAGFFEMHSFIIFECIRHFIVEKQTRRYLPSFWALTFKNHVLFLFHFILLCHCWCETKDLSHTMIWRTNKISERTYLSLKVGIKMGGKSFSVPQILWILRFCLASPTVSPKAHCSVEGKKPNSEPTPEEREQSLL